MKKNSVDMSNGSLFTKIVVFLIPMILTNLLQQLYHMADTMIAGRFAGSSALAAIGSTGYLTGLIVNLFVGISVGASTVIAQLYGAGDKKRLSNAVHTSMAIALIGGFFFSLAGVIFCRPLLILLDTPPAILDEAVLYMRIIFSGYPIVSIYNFGSAILRAKGDTKRPLIFLSISGIINVVLNCVFVIGFNMSVEGVAIPTVISQIVSATLVVICLLHEKEEFRLIIRKIKICKVEAIRILKIGIPAGIQTLMFSVSNVIIQSAINSFGEIAVAGAAAAGNINSLLYTILTPCSHAATIFCGQNYGAQKFGRVSRSVLYCCLICLTLGLFAGGLFTLFGREALGLFSKDGEVVAYGLQIVGVIALPYFINGCMEIFSGGLRALNSATVPMINSMVGLCGSRIIWVYTYFALNRSLRVLYYSYPLSWTITAIMNLVFFVVIFRQKKKKYAGTCNE